jgi:DNA-binding MarR family transcriptional regulator
MIAPAGDDAHGSAFLSNHFLVLLCVARNPDLRVRDIARLVAITERATQAILKDLSDAGYLERIRVGRRSHYRVWRSTRLRQPLVAEHAVGTLIDALADRATNA